MHIFLWGLLGVCACLLRRVCYCLCSQASNSKLLLANISIKTVETKAIQLSNTINYLLDLAVSFVGGTGAQGFTVSEESPDQDICVRLDGPSDGVQVPIVVNFDATTNCESDVRFPLFYWL